MSAGSPERDKKPGQEEIKETWYSYKRDLLFVAKETY
jgi:hypothetical protein